MLGPLLTLKKLRQLAAITQYNYINGSQQPCTNASTSTSTTSSFD